MDEDKHESTAAAKEPLIINASIQSTEDEDGGAEVKKD